MFLFGIPSSLKAPRAVLISNCVLAICSGLGLETKISKVILGHSIRCKWHRSWAGLDAALAHNSHLAPPSEESPSPALLGSEASPSCLPADRRVPLRLASWSPLKGPWLWWQPAASPSGAAESAQAHSLAACRQLGGVGW